jgi:hypothetical protein
MLRAGSSRDRHRAGPDVPFRPRGGADRAGAGAFYVAGPTVVSRVLSPTVVAGVPFLVGRDEAMGLLVRHWEQSEEKLGQVVPGKRQESWTRRGHREVALGGSGGCVPEKNALWNSYPSSRVPSGSRK